MKAGTTAIKTMGGPISQYCAGRIDSPDGAEGSTHGFESEHRGASRMTIFVAQAQTALIWVLALNRHDSVAFLLHILACTQTFGMLFRFNSQGAVCSVRGERHLRATIGEYHGALPKT